MNAAVTGVDCTDVILGFKEWRYAIAVKFNGAFASVITRKRKPYIAIESIKKPSKVLRPAKYILARIENILHSESRRRFWHELHQSRGSLYRNCISVERRFGSHQGQDKTRIQSILRRCLLNKSVDSGI